MKTFYTSLVLLTIVLLNSQIIYPQWVQTNGPGFRGVDCLASSGNIIIASAWNYGVYISTNNGTNWKQVNNDLPNTGVKSFIFKGSNIYAGTTRGIYLTTDNGSNWIQRNNGLIDTSVNVLVVNGDNIFAGTVRSGVFISTNDGTSWVQVNDGITNLNIHCFVVKGNNDFVGTDSGGVFLSTNNGISWKAVSNGLDKIHSIDALAMCGDNIFTTVGGIVYVSTDNGANWSQTNLAQTTKYVNHLASSGNIIFAGSYGTPGGGDVYRSTNYGADWEPLLMKKNTVRCLVSSGNNIFASFGGGNIDFEFAEGLFFSTDNGANWTEIGLPLSTVYSISIIGDNIFAGTFVSGLFQSNKKDGTFMTQLGLFEYSVYSVVVSGTYIFAAVRFQDYSSGAVFLSTDNGTSWKELSIGDNGVRNYALASNGPNIYVGTYHEGVFLSTDQGTDWAQVNNGLTNKDIWFLKINGDNIFAGTNGGVFLSSNNGTSWTQENTGLTDTTVRCIGVKGDNIFAGTPSGVYRSTNNGLEWTQINNGLTNTDVRSFASIGEDIIAGTIGGGVYISTNNGVLWTQIGLDKYSVLSLAVNDTYILAGTDGAGIWCRLISELPLPVELTSFTASVGKGGVVLKWNTATELNNSGFDVERSGNKSDWGKIGFVNGNGNSAKPNNYSFVDKSVSKAGKYFYRLKQVDNNGSYKYSNVAEVEFGAPSSCALNQNYPNPFNPSTMISYRLKEKGFVKLKVYGIKGELVKVLVNEQKDAGYYESEFDGKGLASGVYIYRLEVIGEGNRNVYSDMKKTVLLK